ncbi:hypothetical protein HBN50_13605 [Halobacteriovorax sp. GB3]|uniref:hypothetical protein n=1 Tax=Halobacteriovorax sp. GB3 TaxID=2719615 RepID=UPI00236255F3|nr:hypothetical protein [Halobacteriovorax sp. GB3]MDD0854143.1 hypothetical protein [Halobacteriovorax sp. GB3]
MRSLYLLFILFVLSSCGVDREDNPHLVEQVDQQTSERIDFNLKLNSTISLCDAVDENNTLSEGINLKNDYLLNLISLPKSISTFDWALQASNLEFYYFENVKVSKEDVRTWAKNIRKADQLIMSNYTDDCSIKVKDEVDNGKLEHSLLNMVTVNEKFNQFLMDYQRENKNKIKILYLKFINSLQNDIKNNIDIVFLYDSIIQVKSSIREMAYLIKKNSLERTIEEIEDLEKSVAEINDNKDLLLLFPLESLLRNHLEKLLKLKNIEDL